MKKREILTKAIIDDIKKLEGDDVPIFLVPDNLSKNIAPYLLIVSDIKWMINTTNKLINMKGISKEESYEKGELRALWISMIIVYGKCFSGKAIKLEPMDYFSDEEHELKEIHDDLITIRNEFIAHRDKTDYEHAITYIKISDAGVRFGGMSKTATSQTIKRLTQYIQLFEHLLRKVNERLEEKAQKVYARILKDYPDQTGLALL